MVEHSLQPAGVHGVRQAAGVRGTCSLLLRSPAPPGLEQALMIEEQRCLSRQSREIGTTPRREMCRTPVIKGDAAQLPAAPGQPYEYARREPILQEMRWSARRGARIVG